ncbi:hypothetical protein TBR22_A05270 [Luteitalea sp. TBR-22]|uniref:hypothetical protein n=1 Tax=Luteitalea sp. TBR-22 TaxID=2802971 RepID=UPI001AF5DD2E|nr:hypothetical protein [Luteitalea sp. TBR-22]BCS31327.1 hypothetical protein TBR22_A05270 [Luteitalea sp. TBR-22]
MSEQLKVARILWGSAVLMVVFAVVFYLGLIDLGIPSWQLAAICLGIAVMDVVMSAILLTRRRP